MFAALTWSHPVHGTVTEVVCLAAHERWARAAFAELGITYSARLVAQGRCHRCDGQRPWQGQRRPDGQADPHAAAGPGGELWAPAWTGWFQTAP